MPVQAFDLSRDYLDPLAEGRDPLSVDRQRVTHSSAFRRLQYKTQVFVARAGDHFRSRLTHTLEAAGLASAIAERLGLNAELAEVVALAHDLGHAPFGHAGERALDACVRKHTRGHEGFEHNLHTLRVVEVLEHPYPEFRGLNLTAAVRQCLRTHSTPYDHAAPAAHEAAPLEGQVVALADQLAYTLHDLQDGLYAGLLDPIELTQRAELWRSCYRGPASPSLSECLRHLRPTVERMLALLLDDLKAGYDQQRKEPAGHPGEPFEPGEPPAVSLSPPMKQRLEALSELLAARVYQDRQVVRMDAKAARIVRAIFEAYVDKPELMPRRFVERIEESGVVRVVVDYIAGMTDRFCQDEHARLFDAKIDV